MTLSARYSTDCGMYQADLLGGLEVNDEFKRRRLLYRQVTGLGSFEDFVDEDSDAAR